MYLTGNVWTIVAGDSSTDVVSFVKITAAKFDSPENITETHTVLHDANYMIERETNWCIRGKQFSSDNILHKSLCKYEWLK